MLDAVWVLSRSPLSESYRRTGEHPGKFLSRSLGLQHDSAQKGAFALSRCSRRTVLSSCVWSMHGAAAIGSDCDESLISGYSFEFEVSNEGNITEQSSYALCTDVYLPPNSSPTAWLSYMP